MRTYIAAYGLDNECRIISVLAENEEQAIERIVEELKKNPSRLPYLDIWEKYGRRLIVKDADEKFVRTAKNIQF